VTSLVDLQNATGWVKLELHKATAEKAKAPEERDTARAVLDTATAERAITVLRLETAQLETQHSQGGSRATTPSAGAHSPPTARSPSPFESQGVVHFLCRAARLAQAREERFSSAGKQQRRLDHHDAEERAERAEARHAAELTALRGATNASTFNQNKRFDEVSAFLGEKDQDWLDWLQLFQSRASFLGTPEELITRESCFKLTGVALTSFTQQLAGFAGSCKQSVNYVLTMASQ
jgi:hypothetical protein